MALSKPKIRLFTDQPYQVGESLTLSTEQSHYVLHVMRAEEGEAVMVFNGRDGIWLASVTQCKKKAVVITLQSQLQPYRSSPDIWLAFAPIKHNTDSIIAKATELGVSHLYPVFMQHSVVRNLNEHKLHLYAIEASEQCERHDVPAITVRKDLGDLLAHWPEDRVLLHADESGAGENIACLLPTLKGKKCGVIIGPEGGFSVPEKQLLYGHAHTRSFGMGPRILRADTAAISALSCMQSILGDWDDKPAFQSS